MVQSLNKEEIMFSKTARYYDKIYSFKDYESEVERLLPLIHEHLHSEGDRLLDVACGTGRHIEYLKERFAVEGLDISEELLEIARMRNPLVPFHVGDMLDFDLGSRFDVVTCLFGSIGYVRTLDNLTRAITCMARHLVPGGVLLIEPWFTPDAWHPGTVHAMLIDEPDLKIARVNTSFMKGRISFLDLHHLIGTPEGTEHIVEHHELGLFETDEIRTVLSKAGLTVTYDRYGLMGRGLFIGERSQEELTFP
jgi:ubiquinone/menaquinone biosynthesis C-methylase UbiE